MNAEHSIHEGRKARVVFCLVLVAALVCGVFAVTGFAAGADPANVRVKVDSCSTHTAALSQGSLYVWGTNDNGQFPEVETGYSVEPLKAAEEVSDVSVADGRTLVVYQSGDLYAYGWDPMTKKGGQSEKIASAVAQASCAETYGLFVTKAGELMAWGMNTSGQLGTGDTQNKPTPVKVMENVAKAVAGSDYAFAITEDGALYGWGSNFFQQLGLTGKSATASVSEPTVVAEDVKDVDVGEYYSCILKNDGSLYTCGMNNASQTGVATLASTTPLTQILKGRAIRSVSAGDTYGFAVGENGKVYSWGYGLSGQQGNGSGQRVVGASASDLDFVQVFAGEGASFGVDANGDVWSWGANTNRVLCTASGVDAFEPVKVLNADMTWADNGTEIEVPDDPDHNAPDASGSSEPLLSVATPFISGYTDGTFKPNDYITRAEFLTMVATALTDYDKDTKYEKLTFTDVGNHWYTNVVAYAQEKGLIHGYEDGTCRPEDKITRAEAAKITATALGLSSNATTSSFTDVKERWAISAIEALAERNILSGDGDGTFRPNEKITRAEAAKVVSAYSFSTKDESVMAQVEAITESPFTDVSPKQWYYPFILFAAGKLS